MRVKDEGGHNMKNRSHVLEQPLEQWSQPYFPIVMGYLFEEIKKWGKSLQEKEDQLKNLNQQIEWLEHSIPEYSQQKALKRALEIQKRLTEEILVDKQYLSKMYKEFRRGYDYFETTPYPLLSKEDDHLWEGMEEFVESIYDPLDGVPPIVDHNLPKYLIVGNGHLASTYARFYNDSFICMDLDKSVDPDYIFDLSKANIEELPPFPANHFDFIFFEHLPPVDNIQLMLANAQHLLNENGVILYIGNNYEENGELTVRDYIENNFDYVKEIRSTNNESIKKYRHFSEIDIHEELQLIGSANMVNLGDMESPLLYNYSGFMIAKKQEALSAENIARYPFEVQLQLVMNGYNEGNFAQSFLQNYPAKMLEHVNARITELENQIRTTPSMPDQMSRRKLVELFERYSLGGFLLLQRKQLEESGKNFEWAFHYLLKISPYPTQLGDIVKMSEILCPFWCSDKEKLQGLLNMLMSLFENKTASIGIFYHQEKGKLSQLAKIIHHIATVLNDSVNASKYEELYIFYNVFYDSNDKLISASYPKICEKWDKWLQFLSEMEKKLDKFRWCDMVEGDKQAEHIYKEVLDDRRSLNKLWKEVTGSPSLDKKPQVRSNPFQMWQQFNNNRSLPPSANPFFSPSRRF